jgi:hypothetical protein
MFLYSQNTDLMTWMQFPESGAHFKFWRTDDSFSASHTLLSAYLTRWCSVALEELLKTPRNSMLFMKYRHWIQSWVPWKTPRASRCGTLQRYVFMLSSIVWLVLARGVFSWGFHQECLDPALSTVVPSTYHRAAAYWLRWLTSAKPVQTEPVKWLVVLLLPSSVQPESWSVLRFPVQWLRRSFPWGEKAWSRPVTATWRNDAECIKRLPEV